MKIEIHIWKRTSARRGLHDSRVVTNWTDAFTALALDNPCEALPLRVYAGRSRAGVRPVLTIWIFIENVKD